MKGFLLGQTLPHLLNHCSTDSKPSIPALPKRQSLVSNCEILSTSSWSRDLLLISCLLVRNVKGLIQTKPPRR
ncbi:hypothetical protein Scep_022481 [Stephania cephalantha]|uniref:Uncharacterized protein n=1 Tax=Stephania cephalantha TaxID=152367 RepID=A0AAP0F848_9MAGN